MDLRARSPSGLHTHVLKKVRAGRRRHAMGDRPAIQASNTQQLHRPIKILISLARKHRAFGRAARDPRHCRGTGRRLMTTEVKVL